MNKIGIVLAGELIDEHYRLASVEHNVRAPAAMALWVAKSQREQDTVTQVKLFTVPDKTPKKDFI